MRWNYFLTQSGCVSCWHACLGDRLLPQSYQYSNLSEGADRVAGQLHGDKERPFSGVTKSGRVWRKLRESDAQSVRGIMWWTGVRSSGAAAWTGRWAWALIPCPIPASRSQHGDETTHLHRMTLAGARTLRSPTTESNWKPNALLLLLIAVISCYSLPSGRLV